jgi:hypothetical protein
MNAQERLDYLLETQWVPTNVGVTLTSIENALESNEATAPYFPLVRLTIEGATTPQIIEGMDDSQKAQARFIATRMIDALDVLRSKDGLDLSPLPRQMMIDMLAAAGSWPDAVRDAVKALGGANRPRWQMEGYESEPTLEQITAELLKEDIKSRLDAILNQIGTTEQADAVLALRAMADELEL